MKTNPFPLQLRLLQKSKSIKPIHERHFINVSPEELHAAHPKEIDPQDGLRIRPPALSDVDLHERIGSLVRNGTIVPWQIPIEAHQQQSELQKVDSRFIPWENYCSCCTITCSSRYKAGTISRAHRFRRKNVHQCSYSGMERRPYFNNTTILLEFWRRGKRKS